LNKFYLVVGTTQKKIPALFFSVIAIFKIANYPQSQIGATKALVLEVAWVKVPHFCTLQPVQLDDDIL